jgi:hypothetical protein
VSSATFALLIREAASCRTLFIQRYAWRVEYSGSSTITSTGPIFAAHWTAVPSDIPQSQEAVFRHLLTEHDQPSPYISLSTSLMWALSFAHTKNRQGFHSIRIYLIDTRKLGLAWPYRVWPAVLYIAYLQLQRLDYSNTGHNYLVEGKIPLEAILGLVPIEFDGIRFRDERLRTILPALSETPPEDHPVLLASLERCRKPFTSSQKHDITLTHMHAAFELAYGLLRGGSEHTARDRLAITIMLLALMPRNWPAGRLLLRRFFDGKFLPLCCW